MLHTRIQDWLWTGMDRTKAGCWVWPPAPSQHPERLPSSVLIHYEEEEEEKEEEAGGHPDVCCYTSVWRLSACIISLFLLTTTVAVNNPALDYFYSFLLAHNPPTGCSNFLVPNSAGEVSRWRDMCFRSRRPGLVTSHRPLLADCSGDGVIRQWIFQEAPQESGLAQQRPETPPHLPEVVLEAADEDKRVSQYSDGRCWWEDPGLETQGCICVYQQREPHGLGSCWPGCPYAYSGVRRNLLVGVEVVEEVAIEDTVELITDGVYTPDQLYPP